LVLGGLLNNMKKVLIGNGGHAKEVIAQMGVNLLRFVDDQYVDEDTLPLSQFNPKKHVAMVAVANSKDRYDIVQRLPKETQFFTFIHPTALLMDNVEIGEGSFIGAYSILTTNIKIGKHSILNRGNHIGHDCIIGDYFSAMPGSIVSGNVRIYDMVYMGNNSSIREKLSVHSLSTIGMNSAVVKHIEETGTYVGCPALKIK
jgi:sugar O-acyltransferase (sialic acid O-acetyltransferase NeuD family)